MTDWISVLVEYLTDCGSDLSVKAGFLPDAASAPKQHGEAYLSAESFEFDNKQFRLTVVLPADIPGNTAVMRAWDLSQNLMSESCPAIVRSLTVGRAEFCRDDLSFRSVVRFSICDREDQRHRFRLTLPNYRYRSGYAGKAVIKTDFAAYPIMTIWQNVPDSVVFGDQVFEITLGDVLKSDWSQVQGELFAMQLDGEDYFRCSLVKSEETDGIFSVTLRASKIFEEEQIYV